MTITVIKSGYSIKQILIGKSTPQIEMWVKQLNDNPLYEEEVTIEEKYTDKNIYDLQQFFNLD
jgi:hypothetical protein